MNAEVYSIFSLSYKKTIFLINFLLPWGLRQSVWLSPNLFGARLDSDGTEPKLFSLFILLFFCAGIVVRTNSSVLFCSWVQRYSFAKVSIGTLEWGMRTKLLTIIVFISFWVHIHRNNLHKSKDLAFNPRAAIRKPISITLLVFF